MRAAVETVVALPEEVSFTTGAAISCGTGTAYGALVRLNVSARDTVAAVRIDSSMCESLMKWCINSNQYQKTDIEADIRVDIRAAVGLKFRLM